MFSPILHHIAIALFLVSISHIQPTSLHAEVIPRRTYGCTRPQTIVRWHGLFVPSEIDGAMEEGSPMVPKGGTKIYSFTPKPFGTRWYHSHNTAGQDLSRSTYSGLFGFMLIEPTNDPGNYDRE